MSKHGAGMVKSQLTFSVDHWKGRQ